MKILFMLFPFILYSCGGVISNEPSYNNVMKEINIYSSQIKKDKGICRTWYGLDYAGPDKIYDGKIHQIDLGYRIDKAMKFDVARAYFYEVVDGLLERINKNEKLKEYFYHYPVGYEDLHFCLSFDHENKGSLKRDEIRAIHIEFNKIFYEIIEEEGPSEPILESRGFGLSEMKGYTKEPICISRKLPEPLDTRLNPDELPRKPSPEAVKNAQINLLEFLATGSNKNDTIVSGNTKTMAEIMAKISYFDEKLLLDLSKLNKDFILVYLFNNNKKILPENFIDYLISNKLIKKESK